jgi:peptide/nickel transport system substrate-binding protein
MMREPEQRVTGLLNGEVQIARLIPPQLVERLESREDLQVMKTNTIEQMFVAFNNKMEPWTDVRIRRAAAMAINRPLIIDRLLRGLATPLVGMINEEQICYTGAADRPVPYDPEASKKLLAEAGYADGGPEIEFFTASGRDISDRQVSEAVTQMLEAVGFKVTLNTPEWANLWADVRAGKAPMYYMGRNSVHDPVDSMAQLFETDNTKRVGYSNPEFDRVLRESNTKFDPKERCALLREANQHLLDDVPAMFMWSHKLVTGVQAGLHVPISPTGEIWWSSVQVN